MNELPQLAGGLFLATGLQVEFKMNRHIDIGSYFSSGNFPWACMPNSLISQFPCQAVNLNMLHTQSDIQKEL